MMDHWNVSILGDGTAPGGLRYFYYDGWNLIEDGTSPWNPEHFYVNGARIDEIVASYTWGVPSYHRYDANGNCMTLTHAAGNITEQYYYDAFGKPYIFDGAGNYSGDWSPSGKSNRYLRIGDVRSDPPDAIYLVFPNSLSDHSAVINRCGVKQHSIDWKAIDYNSP